MTLRNLGIAASIMAAAACTPSGRTSSEAASETDSTDNKLYIAVGAFSQALNIVEFDPATGSGEVVQTLATAPNPSFLTVDPERNSIFAVFENNGAQSLWQRFTFDPATRRIAKADSTTAVGDNGACNVILTPDRRRLVTANYPHGSVSVFELDSAGDAASTPELIRFAGSGPDSERQECAHLHSVAFSPDGRWAYAADLGTDHLYIWPVGDGSQPFDTDRREVALTPGSGPRHMAFNRDGSRLYLINEISDDVTTFEVAGDGSLKPLQTVKVNEVSPKGCADIHISPDGRHLYASARLENDGIAAFEIDPADSTLRPAGYTPTGGHPRNFMITPDGRYVIVASRDDNRLEIYSRDASSGTLADTGNRIPVERPVCVVALP